MRKLNRPIEIIGDKAVIHLQSGLKAIIDADDIDKVRGRTWHAIRAGRSIYAVANVKCQNGGWTSLRLHRVIKQTPPKIEIDHEDGNGLNCTKRNLRVATRKQNARNVRKHRDNSSGFKGVTPHPGNKPWRARICVDGKRIHLGVFATPQDANAAYATAALIHFGDFSRPG
jgi:hypothetical protein